MTMMNAISRPFAAWVTSFRRDPFRQARWKLTLYYLLGIVGILVVFNLAVYEIFVSNAFDTIKYGSPDTLQNDTREITIIEQAEDRLERILYLVDALILILVPFLSYVLAGKTLQPIEKMHQQQKKFIADAAHELRTPLAVMKAGAEATLAGSGPVAEYEKLLRESLEEIDRMAAMVDDLLFLARADSARPVPLLPVDLSALVKSQVERMESYAQKKGMSLDENIDMGGVPAFHCDAAGFKRLVANLVGNALEHNQPGGTVTVGLKPMGQHIELSVSDTGSGIAATDLPHIFDRFYTGDPARTTTKGTGAGLGLSIVKEIADIHRGKITVESEPGKGTVIRIDFPLH
jgi:signal transduction histidine kinase